MRNSGGFSQGKPGATEQRYPTLINEDKRQIAVSFTAVHAVSSIAFRVQFGIQNVEGKMCPQIISPTVLNSVHLNLLRVFIFYQLKLIFSNALVSHSQSHVLDSCSKFALKMFGVYFFVPMGIFGKCEINSGRFSRGKPAATELT